MNYSTRTIRLFDPYCTVTSMQVWVSSQARYSMMFTLYYGVVKDLVVLYVDICFFLTRKPCFKYAVTSIIYYVICVSHGRVFTAVHPDIMLHYYCYMPICRSCRDRHSLLHGFCVVAFGVPNPKPCCTVLLL